MQSIRLNELCLGRYNVGMGLGLLHQVKDVGADVTFQVNQNVKFCQFVHEHDQGEPHLLSGFLLHVDGAVASYQ